MDEREEPTKVMSRPQPGREDIATREMDRIEIGALIEQEYARARSQRSPTIPAPDDRLQALVAQTTPDPDDDLAIPVEGSQAFKKQPALVVDDLTGEHPRHDEVEDREVVVTPRLPTAPPSHARLYVLLVLLALAIAGALAFYQLT